MASSNNHNGLPIEGVVESSQPSTPRADLCKALPFMCSICNKRYAQRQGLNRHYGEKHDPNLCKYCKFEWIRPYEYRAHLEKCHPNENSDEALGKPAKSRRRTAAFVGRRPQHDSEPRRRPRTPSPPAVAKVMHLPPAFSFTGEDTQRGKPCLQVAASLPERTQCGGLPISRCNRIYPPLPPHVGEYYGSSAFFDPIVGLSGLMHPYPFSVDSYDGI
jgi:hypothetical protein